MSSGVCGVPPVFLCEKGSWSIPGLNEPILLFPVVIGRLRILNGVRKDSDALALGNQLVSGNELAHNLHGCVTDTIFGEALEPVWPE